MHLQRRAAATGRVDERLIAPDLPPCLQVLWQACLQLVLQRRSGLAAQALTFVDIESWCRLQLVQLTPWELDTLLELDHRLLRGPDTKPAPDS